MTNRERAIAWMKEECGAADGPRFHVAEDEPDVPGEPHCDCLESLTKLLAETKANAAKVCRELAANVNDHGPDVTSAVRKALNYASEKIER